MTKKRFLEITGYDKSRVVAKRNGTFEVLLPYYFRPKTGAKGWGQKVVKKLQPLGSIFKLIGAEDRCKSWPDQSYFVAIIEPIK